MRWMLRTCGVAIAICMFSIPARADGPEIGTNLGAAIPLGKYRRTIDHNVGGTAGISAGYRFDLSDSVALSLLANPQFTVLPTQDGCCNGKRDDEVSSTFSITGGPKLSYLTGIVETYVDGQAGYYRDMTGPMRDDGLGFNAGAGLNFALPADSSIGLFGRYDYARMAPDAGSHDDVRQWLLAGFAFTKVFEPAPERIVAEAPPPPPPPPRRHPRAVASFCAA